MPCINLGEGFEPRGVEVLVQVLVVVQWASKFGRHKGFLSLRDPSQREVTDHSPLHPWRAQRTHFGLLFIGLQESGLYSWVFQPGHTLGQHFLWKCKNRNIMPFRQEKFPKAVHKGSRSSFSHSWEQTVVLISSKGAEPRCCFQGWDLVSISQIAVQPGKGMEGNAPPQILIKPGKLITLTGDYKPVSPISAITLLWSNILYGKCKRNTMWQPRCIREVNGGVSLNQGNAILTHLDL